MNIRTRLTLGAAVIALLGSGATAQAASPPVNTATGTEGTDVSEVVVTAEQNAAAIAAPSKASLLETQARRQVRPGFAFQTASEKLAASWKKVNPEDK